LKDRIRAFIPSLHHEHESYSWWVLLSVMIGTFMAVLDATIVNVGLPKMMAIFGTSVDKIEWVLTAYLLVFAVMLPSSGWVADHFGYKRTYFMGMFFFTLGSFLCSLAWDENALIVFRIVQGAGAGFLMPVGLAIVTKEFPPEKRGMAVGFWGIASAASVSLGPLVGGYLIDTFSWHAIFDVNIPVGIIGLLAIWIIQQEHRAEDTRSFDIIGFISMSTFLISLLLGLADGNAAWNTGGWTSHFILTCFGIAIVSFVIFMITEFTVEHPLLDLRLLRIRNFAISNIMLFLFGLALFGNSFLVPLYLQTSLDYTPFQSGLVFLPMGVLQAMMSPLSGWLADKINPKIPITIGTLLFASTFYMFHFLSLTSEHSQIMLPLYLRGIGVGLIFSPVSATALMSIPKVKMAQASGLFNTIRQIGGSFGVAMFGALLTRRVIYHTGNYGQAINQNSEMFKHTVSTMKNMVKYSSGGSGSELIIKSKLLIAKNAVAQAFVQGINDDFFLASVITLVLLIPMMFLKISKIKNQEKIELID